MSRYIMWDKKCIEIHIVFIYYTVFFIIITKLSTTYNIIPLNSRYHIYVVICIMSWPLCHDMYCTTPIVHHWSHICRDMYYVLTRVSWYVLYHPYWTPLITYMSWYVLCLDPCVMICIVPPLLDTTDHIYVVICIMSWPLCHDMYCTTPIGHHWSHICRDMYYVLTRVSWYVLYHPYCTPLITYMSWYVLCLDPCVMICIVPPLLDTTDHIYVVICIMSWPLCHDMYCTTPIVHHWSHICHDMYYVLTPVSWYVLYHPYWTPLITYMSWYVLCLDPCVMICIVPPLLDTTDHIYVVICIMSWPLCHDMYCTTPIGRHWSHICRDMYYVLTPVSWYVLYHPYWTPLITYMSWYVLCLDPCVMICIVPPLLDTTDHIYVVICIMSWPLCHDMYCTTPIGHHWSHICRDMYYVLTPVSWYVLYHPYWTPLITYMSWYVLCLDPCVMICIVPPLLDTTDHIFTP